MQRAGSVLTFELSQPFEARAVTVRRGKRENHWTLMTDLVIMLLI